MKRAYVVAVVLATGVSAPARAQDGPVVVSSKTFTESVLLGEIATQLLRDGGVAAEHRRELGGTRILFNALVAGEIDVYAEYTGTILQEIFADLGVSTDEEIRDALSQRGLRMTEPLGFNNSYGIGMVPAVADSLGARTISDLARYPELRIAFSNEFMDRQDGWPSLQRAYGLSGENVRGLDHDLAYRALDERSIDAMDVYTTDAEIAYYGLRVLDDDREFFQTCNAVYLYRADLDTRAPGVSALLARLEGTLDEARISGLNARVKLDGESEARVAARFLGETLDVAVHVEESGWLDRLWLRTVEHLFLVAVSMTLGVLVAVPLGVAAFKRPRAGQLILAVVGIIQTVPALALLVLMIPFLGIYAPPAIAALFLYSLLPIVRNTHAGLSGISPGIEESMVALDLDWRTRLLRIELPLASPAIMAGIKTATVINIGFATLGALIGAGGYGQPILTGIRLDDFGLILEGALPAAALAIVAQGLFGLVERGVVPRGLRLRREG